MTVEAEELSPDLQEAKTIRYISGIRLALLTSGNWAIWFEAQGTSRLEITPALDEGWMRSLAEAERRERAQGWAGHDGRRQALLENTPAALVAGKDAEDLGL